MSVRPRVLLKLATSLDGRIALSNGQSRWITGPQARARVHRLRAAADGVLVGGGTLRADDPALTARTDPPAARQPLRIALDRTLGLPEGARLLQGLDQAPTALVHGAEADPERVAALRARGVRLYCAPVGEGGLDLGWTLAALAKDGVRTLLVEGGGILAASLLKVGLVDEIEWHRAPVVLGGDGRACLGGLGLVSLGDAPRFERVSVEALGPDLIERYVITGA